jgi:hypothetical protein
MYFNINSNVNIQWTILDRTLWDMTWLCISLKAKYTSIERNQNSSTNWFDERHKFLRSRHKILSCTSKKEDKYNYRLLIVMRVNSTNVLDEGLRIGRIGRRKNSEVKISQTRCVSRINMVINLAYSRSIPDRPLLAPIYRWPGLEEPVGSDTYYNVCIRHGLVFWLWIFLGLT